MAKIKFTENSKTFVMDTTQFISSALLTDAASNAFELLTANGLISLGGVAHFFGEGLDAASGGFADTGIVTKGEGDGGFADGSGLSKVGHT